MRGFEDEFLDHYLQLGLGSMPVNADKRKALFKSVAKKFAEGAASKAGGGVVAVLRAHLGV